MPVEDCVWREQRSNLGERLAPNGLSFHSYSSALVIGQQDSLVAELLFQDSQLCFQTFDFLLLLAINPTGKD